MSEDSSEERLLRGLLEIEKHEDRMMTVMVQLMASSERLNKRLGVLTWLMLILTWITLIISIPNTLATIFGIPQVSQVLGLEVMIAALVTSTVGALLLLILPRSTLSFSKLEKTIRETRTFESKSDSSKRVGSRRAVQLERKKSS